MYAVVRTGGKQYRVSAGDILEVEKLDGAVGDTITLDDVLLVSTGDELLVGQPNVADASVTAKITGQYRGKKILVFRYRPKKRIRVRRGHRQYLTRLEIESISAAGKTLEAPAAESANGTRDEADGAADIPVSDTHAAATDSADAETAVAQDTDIATGAADEVTSAEAPAEDAVTDASPEDAASEGALDQESPASDESSDENTQKE